MDEVIWVVSDVHLGAESSNHTEFSKFLEWASGNDEFNIIGKKSKVFRPTTLILLGDFLELWNPVDNDFKNTALHLFESLKGLLAAAGEVVFVTGNHDEAMEAYEAVYPIKDPSFQIIRRHYPDEMPRYIQVGDRRYFFLHGHQFDKLFLWLGSLSGFPTVMASLNNLFIKIFPPQGWGAPLIFFFLAVLRIMFSWPSNWVLFASALISVPRIFTYLQGSFWRRFGKYLIDKPKHLDIEGLINKKYYDKKKDTMTADFVVYGHTHVPEISSAEISKSLGKTLINAGSWISDDKPTKKNTIVVIDERGANLLQWEGTKKGFSLLDSFPKE